MLEGIVGCVLLLFIIVLMNLGLILLINHEVEILVITLPGHGFFRLV